MRHTITLLDINLRLFDGAAAAAGASAEGAAAGSAQGDNSALPKADKLSGRSRRSRSGAFDNVVFGKQDVATSEPENVETPAAEGAAEGNSKTDVTTTSNTLEDKRKAFRELIEGEYKEQYAQEFQEAFNRRHKEAKAMENSLNAQKPIIDMLMQKYNIADGDVAKLQAAIEQDDTYWEDAAEKAGMTVEQYKTNQKLERDSAELQRLRRSMQAHQQAQDKLSAIYREADQVKELYPTFDLKAEAQNRDFMGLLQRGVSVKQAYELMHMDEIKESAARSAAQTAGEQMAARMKSKASRPQENGTSTQSAATFRDDVHSLSRAERAEIARRVQRGESIKF